MPRADIAETADPINGSHEAHGRRDVAGVQSLRHFVKNRLIGLDQRAIPLAVCCESERIEPAITKPSCASG